MKVKYYEWNQHHKNTNNDNKKPLHDRIQQNINDNYINLSPSQLFSVQ